MSGDKLAKIGGFTVVAAVTATTQAKALGTNNAMNVIIYNSGTNAAFVNSGKGDIAVAYPTTGTGQYGAVIQPAATFTYEKNNASDTHLAVICDTGLTTTLNIQSVNGE